VVIDGKEDKQYDGLWEGTLIRFSPDSKRVAYNARVGKEGFVVIDGKKEYGIDLGLSNPIFSPDSKRVAYEALVHHRDCVFVDGKEVMALSDVFGPLLFSPDSQHIAWVNTMMVIEQDEKGKELRSRHEYFVVMDGKEGKQYDGFLEGVRIIFDSPHTFHYLAIKESNNIYLVEEKIQ